jgi:hypothetical protein
MIHVFLHPLVYDSRLARRVMVCQERGWPHYTLRTNECALVLHESRLLVREYDFIELCGDVMRGGGCYFSKLQAPELPASPKQIDSIVDHEFYCIHRACLFFSCQFLKLHSLFSVHNASHNSVQSRNSSSEAEDST